MKEKVVIVASNNLSSGFCVVDFSNAPGTIPSPIHVSTSGGCVVDCSQQLAAVGNYTGTGVVTIYDVSTPASPKAIGSTPTLSSVISISNHTPQAANFQGIGSISFYGGYVLAGEAGYPVVDNTQVDARVAG